MRTLKAHADMQQQHPSFDTVATTTTKKDKTGKVTKPKKVTNKTLANALPKFKFIKLKEIKVEPNELSGDLLGKFRYISNNAPLVKVAALPYIELTEPIIVTKQELSESYQLIAGHRTLQLLLEHRNRSVDKCKVMILNEQSKAERNEFQAIDVVVNKIIQRPDDRDLALLATELVDNKPLNLEVNKFLPVNTHAEICNVFGIQRTTLHNMSTSVRELKMAKKDESAATGTVNINITSDDEGVQNE